MRFFDSCVWFGGLVFVSMLRRVVHDLKAVLNFSDMPDAYGIIAVPVGFSCAVWLSVFLCFFVSIRTAFRWCTILWSILTKIRPPNQTQESKNCIYNIPCECGKRYIGETCRPLQTIINEPKRNTTNGEIDKSKIAEHSWEQEHKFRWDKASIIMKKIQGSGNSKNPRSFIVHTM